MKLRLLKQKVWESWRDVNLWQGDLLQPEAFEQEMQQFGDRRHKATWVKALVRFEALFAYKSCLDAYALILHNFNFNPDRWDYEFRYEILEEFLQFPEGLNLLRLGLEQLVSSSFTPEDRREADGFFGLVKWSKSCLLFHTKSNRTIFI
jgi:hypothetical protein